MRGGLEVLADTLGTTEAGARRWLIETAHEIRVATICDLRRLYPGASVAKLARAASMTGKSAALHLRDAGLVPPAQRRPPRLDAATVEQIWAWAETMTAEAIADRLGIRVWRVRFALRKEIRSRSRHTHKLTRDQIEEIVRRAGSETDTALAAEFGVSRTAIQYHRRRAGKAAKK